MTTPAGEDDSALAGRLLAVDPRGLGGVVLRAGPGPERDAWLVRLRALLPPTAPFKRAPCTVDDDRLLGGLDLAATLSSGRRIAGRGLLAEADGGILVLAMAERAGPGLVARVAASLDTGVVHLERDGLTLLLAARFGLVALDEGIAPDEQVSQSLRDRLALHVEPGPPGIAVTEGDRDAVSDARRRLAAVVVRDAVVESICHAATALGIASGRGAILALAAARAHAALSGRAEIDEEDAAVAARLVLGPRATRIPERAAEAEGPEESPPPREQPCDGGEDRNSPIADPTADLAVRAARAAVPEHLLDGLHGPQTRAASAPSGRSRTGAASAPRGRPIGLRAGAPRRGERLSVSGTLRAAAPWQVVRQRERAGEGSVPTSRVLVTPEDFRSTRFKARERSTTIFVVDASGSAALHRLAEAKGAVALLLEQSYVRRDRVALVAFRNRGAEVLLSPTRSLARARRCLEHLPGGGGTPLAAGLEAAVGIALAVRREREAPCIVLLGDGRPNVTRDGSAGRREAEADALATARLVRSHGIPALCIDTAPRPQAYGRALAAEMGAHYLPLPQADAAAVSSAASMIRPSSRAAYPQ